MRYKFVYAAVAAAPIALLAWSTGSPVDNTGRIPGQDCSSCHNNSGATNSDSRGSIKVDGLGPYNPGVVQHLKLTVRHPDAIRWGFQMGARFINGGGNVQAGTFNITHPNTKVVCDNGTPQGGPPPCDGTLEWIEHSDAPRTARGGDAGEGYSFEFDWMPPAQENGDIVFTFAAVAANGDGGVGGDRVYAGSMRVSLSSSAACTISEPPVIQKVVNAGPHAGSISSGAMVEIYGSGFQTGARKRAVGLGDLGAPPYHFPTELSCIAVEINGKRAPITYVQQDQINVQAPDLTGVTGPVSVNVIGNPGRQNEIHAAAKFPVQVQPLAPSFFTLGVTKSIAALIAGTAKIVADPSVVPGGVFAKPGDLVSLFGSGFGATDPALQPGEVSSGEARLAGNITVKIGDQTLAPGDIQYAGLAPQSISALYQFNVRIPPGAPNGDMPVVITINGVSTQPGATIPVRAAQ
jgi:uncharacterized protein (TIGR03437 family)